MTVGSAYTGLAYVADRAVHLVLPALALASFFVAVCAAGARLDARGPARFHPDRARQRPLG